MLAAGGATSMERMRRFILVVLIACLGAPFLFMKGLLLLFELLSRVDVIHEVDPTFPAFPQDVRMGELTCQ